MTLETFQEIQVGENKPCPVFSKNLDYFINYTDENRDIYRSKDNGLVITIPDQLWDRVKT